LTLFPFPYKRTVSYFCLFVRLCASTILPVSLARSLALVAFFMQGSKAPDPHAAGAFGFRLVRDSGRSILREHRKQCSVHDFHSGFSAADAAALETARPVDLTRNIGSAGGKPVFYFTDASPPSVVVDSSVFPDGLRVAGVSRIPRGEALVLGTVRRRSDGRLPFDDPTDLVRLLLVSDSILTYVHDSSECEVRGTEEWGSFEGSRVAMLHATIEGSHVFFTNEKNVEAFKLSLEIDAPGRMSVRSN
jgi:hypothetical protein